MPLSDLTPEQQSAFHRRLKELQMNPEQVIKRIDSETHKGPMILSADPKVSTFKGHTLTITSLDEAKRLGGNADSLFEQGLMKERDFEIPHWPANLNDQDTSSLTPAQNQLVNRAHTAYLYGNSKRVASYKSILEKLKYPVTVTALAVEDMCLDATNSPFVVASNAPVDIGTLTICNGGWIKVEADANFTVQVMKKVDESSCPKEFEA